MEVVKIRAVCVGDVTVGLRMDKLQSGVMCDVCESWYHKLCGGLGKGDFDYFRGSESMWVCLECRKVVRGAGAKIKELENENVGLRGENQKMMGKLDEILHSMREMKTDIKRELKDEIVKELKEEIMEEMKDVDEKKKRECNIIVMGLKEQERDDKNVIESLLENELGLMNVSVESVMRLRGRNESNDSNNNSVGRPNPILVKMKTAGQKWAVIGKAKNLRNAERMEYKRVMILPDLTVKERMEDKRLRDELRKRRDDGENGLYISKGQIRQRCDV